MRKNNWDSGNVVEIELEDRSFSYGVVLADPLMAFSKYTYMERPVTFTEVFKEIAFKIWIMKYAIGKKGWPFVGEVALPGETLERPKFYKYDLISKKFSHYVDCANDIPVTQEQCVGLECAAV